MQNQCMLQIDTLEEVGIQPHMRTHYWSPIQKNILLLPPTPLNLS